MTLTAPIIAGELRALARGITQVENGHPQAQDLLASLYGHTGRAHVCGITGPPGAGKSTLTQCLALALCRAGQRVAIVAVDPSSPFTGGALLGDRIRMDTALEQHGVFMRSLANRGHVGGLSTATNDVVSLIDAAGFDTVLVETVGAGQSEIEIMRLAHTTVVVSVPGLGDDVQADKAGILEIADLFAVNKADRDGADRTANDLEKMVSLTHMGKPGVNRWGDSAAKVRHALDLQPAYLVRRFGGVAPGAVTWRPPVAKTVATAPDTGANELVAQVFAHRDFLVETGRWQAGLRARAEERVRDLVSLMATRRLFDEPNAQGCLDAMLDDVAARVLDPRTAAERLFQTSPPAASNA